MSVRQLIVNADDLGQSEGINRGIFEAFECGIVTSASLMVRGEAVSQAVATSREFPKLSLGLHVDLGEWIYEQGQWTAVYEVVPFGDEHAVFEEVMRQRDTFRRLLGRDPSHLDSHQHVHRREPVRSFMIDLAKELRVPLRHFTSDIRYCGDFYGQTTDGTSLPEAISSESLGRIIRRLPDGITELACHPGYVESVKTMYRDEREQELRALCDPRIHSVIAEAGVTLCSFADVQLKLFEQDPIR